MVFDAGEVSGSIPEGRGPVDILARVSFMENRGINTRKRGGCTKRSAADSNVVLRTRMNH